MTLARVAAAGLLAAAGCAHDVISTNLTWTREVSRIVYRHCAQCHREGGKAFSLMTYDDARPWAKAMRDAVLTRRMPPWDAVEGVGDFRDDPSLSEPEMEVLVAWVEGGAPEGDRANLPKRPRTDGAAPEVAGKSLDVKGTLVLPESVRVIGIRPSGAVEVAACLPDGSVKRLLWVRQFHAESNRTYALREPVLLPRGTRVAVYSANGGARLIVAPAR